MTPPPPTIPDDDPRVTVDDYARCREPQRAAASARSAAARDATLKYLNAPLQRVDLEVDAFDHYSDHEDGANVIGAPCIIDGEPHPCSYRRGALAGEHPAREGTPDDE